MAGLLGRGERESYNRRVPSWTKYDAILFNPQELGMAAKTTCPISRQEFKEKGKPIEVIIDGNKMIGAPREFSTGSLGWNISSKMTMMIGEHAVTVQVGLNLTIVGSKELPKE